MTVEQMGVNEDALLAEAPRLACMLPNQLPGLQEAELSITVLVQ